MTYQRQMAPDDEIIAVLQELAERFPERGFGKYLCFNSHIVQAIFLITSIRSVKIKIKRE